MSDPTNPENMSQDTPSNHQSNTSHISQSSFSSSFSNPSSKPSSSPKTSVKLSTKFRKFTSETHQNIPILHPTTITSTADTILKIIENGIIIAIIPLHKQLLIDNIPYFRTRLNSAWENTGDLSLDTEIASKSLIFKYFQMRYGSEAVPDESNAGGLFQLSEYLQDEEMTNVFKSFIRENIDNSVFFVAWRMGDDFVEIECLNYLKKHGLFGLLDGFKQAAMQLIETSLCKFIEKAVEVIKPREQGHLLDFLKLWLVQHEIKTLEAYTRIFEKIPFEKFVNHFKQIFKIHLLEMLDPELKLSEIQPLMSRILDETKIGSSNIGSSNTINNKEIRKRIFPHETIKNEYLIPFKKIKEDKAEYRGGVISNKPNGKGSKKWDNGTVHYGEWKNGVPNGAGVRTWANDGLFSGIWVDGEWRQGAYIWPTGTTYVGEFKSFKRHGHGLFIYDNGDRYTGEWDNDMKHGAGSYIYKNKTRYTGTWKFSTKCGQGFMSFLGGDSYQGEWKNNEKHGRGVYTYATGSVYDGFWDNSFKNGKGIFVYHHGDVYQGDYLMNQKTGKGHYVYGNGDCYVGDWERDLKNGKGTYWYQGKKLNKKGDCYIGNWRNGQKHGFGVYIKANGSYFEGQWINNAEQGEYVDVASETWTQKIIPAMPERPNSESFGRLVAMEGTQGNSLSGGQGDLNEFENDLDLDGDEFIIIDDDR